MSLKVSVYCQEKGRTRIGDPTILVISTVYIRPDSKERQLDRRDAEDTSKYTLYTCLGLLSPS